tara:strand:+ start:83215 stop:83508 length:294 start_codon:yes stop_codon:yes gene_type:complete
MISILPISLISYFIYFSIQKRNKLKNGIYAISTCSETDTPKYYMVLAAKQGKHFDARELPKLYHLFIPNHISSLIKTTYNDYESAQESLNEFKTKIQ